MVTPAARREAVAHLRSSFDVSETAGVRGTWRGSKLGSLSCPTTW
jgi:hypothetical protein